jgi:transcription termination factor Rho
VSVPERKQLEQSALADLHAIASESGIEGYRRLRKPELIEAILASSTGEEAGPDQGQSSETDLGDSVSEKAQMPSPSHDNPDEGVCTGVLDILPNGSGFVRAKLFAHSEGDVYISPAQIRRCELRAGDEVSGPVRPPRRSERYPSLVRVEVVNAAPAEPPPLFATEPLRLPQGLEQVTFGKGSRVAVSGAPGAGATTLLRRIAEELSQAHPEIDTVVVLAGVRPEEVTDWKRTTQARVAGSGCDRPIDEQAQVSDMAMEYAKRAVEQGRDAAVLIDSLDSLPQGVARRAFAAARNTEESGSLTVVGVVDPYGELQRLATTRIVLDITAAPGAPLVDAALSQTMRSELLQ